MKLEPGMAYDTKKLNKLFALLAVIFLITVVWMVLDDSIRPWKAVQIKALKIEKEVLISQQREMGRAIVKTAYSDSIGEDELNKAFENDDKANKDNDPNNNDENLKKYLNQYYTELEQKKSEGQEIANQKSAELAQIDNKIEELNAKLSAEKLVNGKLSADFSERKFQYEMALAKNKKGWKKLKADLTVLDKKFADSKDRKKSLERQLKDLNNKKKEIKSDLLAAEKNYEDQLGGLNRLKQSYKKINYFSGERTKETMERDVSVILRNLPLLDFLDPSIKIHQVVLKDYVDDRYFRMTDKVDRCMTCHVFIDRKGFENQEHPYKTHPNLDLMVGANSNHPMKTVGCTNCHGGEGHRVNDFSSAAHIPEDEKEKQAWIEKYHWHAPHKVPKEMYKLKYTESQCLKCHGGTENIAFAPKLMKGKQMIEENGCYACHKIPGFENKMKPGPSLEKVASKLSKEWIKNWIWNPHLFNKNSKMPSFFNQSNNQRPDFQEKNIAEVNAIAEVIYEKSKSYSTKWKFKGGSAEKGKALIQEIGCMGCHQVAGVDEEFTKANNGRGPHLVNLGSKLDGDWLVSWLIEPSHYSEKSIMPSFRLTEKEANDIATFLLKSKNKKFEQLQFAGLNKEIRDEILTTYLSTFDTIAGAKANLEKMSDRERTMELGRRSINKYGCYSCHDINGFEGLPPIGPDLSTFGSKPITQLGFGHEHIEHRLDTWVEHHLVNPKRWDKGVEKPFKDLLRMPMFYFTKEEVEPMVTYLLGLVDEKIPERGLRNLNAHEKIARKGEILLDKYNCTGCHKVGKNYKLSYGGEILKNYEDDVNIGPPMLLDFGSRARSEWIHHFLGNVFPIREHLAVRMPSFNLSYEERNDLASYFQHLSEKDTFIPPPPKNVSWLPGEKKAALKLWENLACYSCHTGVTKIAEPLAPNLKVARKKLRPEWIKRWLKNPQAILPETTMPNFWTDGVADDSETLDGDMDKQINALTKLILEFGWEDNPKPYPRIQ